MTGKPVQFRLWAMFVAVAAAALVAALFRWVGTETAVVIIIVGLLLWPLRRTDWPATLKTLGWLSVLLAVLLALMAYASLLKQS